MGLKRAREVWRENGGGGGHMGSVGGFRIGINLIKIQYMHYEIPK